MKSADMIQILSEQGYYEKQAGDIQEAYTNLLVKSGKHSRKTVVLDYEYLNRVFLFAAEKHRNTKRKNGDYYITHPIAVASIVIEMENSTDLIAAALLHDVIEDEGVTYEELEELFGKSVADLVEAVTNLDKQLTEESKKDVDERSNEKLIRSIRKNPRALYIKAADRIHNLRNSDVFSFSKKQEKAAETREVIIELLKHEKMFKPVEILEELCFKIENGKTYNHLSKLYDRMIAQNTFGYEETRGWFAELVQTADGSLDPRLYYYDFFPRYIFSIHRAIMPEIENINRDLEKPMRKDNVALYDIYFVSRDEAEGSAADVFFSLYENAFRKYEESRNKMIRGEEPPRLPNLLTIISVRPDPLSNIDFLLAEDSYGIRYRLFAMKESLFRKRMQNVSSSTSAVNLGPKKDRQQEAAIENVPQMRVFRKDGSAMMIDRGATVLDFAFQIHPEVGVCFNYAMVNDEPDHLEPYARLNDGDKVEIVSDTSKDNPEESIPHAKIRWFEYLKTNEARRALSRYLEDPTLDASDKRVIYDKDMNPYEIGGSMTILDCAFLFEEENGLHFKSGYLNKCKDSSKPGKSVRDGDIVRIETDEACEPKIEWFGWVKTRRAREALIRWFSSKQG